MIEAYKKFWKGYVDFEGRSTRSDYWFAYLANMLTVIAFYVLLAIFGGIASATESSFLAVISFIILLSSLCCCVNQLKLIIHLTTSIILSNNNDLTASLGCFLVDLSLVILEVS